MDKNLTQLPPTAQVCTQIHVNVYMCTLATRAVNCDFFFFYFQVADQQGKYLGHLLTVTDGDVTKQSVLELQKASIRPFVYHHFGSFAYVGDNKAVLQMPVIGIVCV